MIYKYRKNRSVQLFSKSRSKHMLKNIMNTIKAINMYDQSPDYKITHEYYAKNNTYKNIEEYLKNMSNE